jgi:bifunctional DNA-binding transcriptional regulator/antitoxin component of YhaV-PrlF toxin-antitoxin module
MRHIVIMPRRVWRHKITSAGQVSIPAEIRDRWGVVNVLIRDEGERLVVLPLAGDPIEGLQGILKDKGRTDISSTEALRLWREEDNAAMDRKWREYYRD